MSKQKYTSIPQAHVDNLYKKIAELEKEKGVLIQAGCDLCFYAEHTEEHRRAREEFPCRYD
jgi:hypothetical protein